MMYDDVLLDDAILAEAALRYSNTTWPLPPASRLSRGKRPASSTDLADFCSRTIGTLERPIIIEVLGLKCLLTNENNILEGQVATESVRMPLGSEYSYGDESSYIPSAVVKTQVFVKHLHGTLSLQINTSMDVNYLKEEVEKRMQMDVSGYFFISGLSVLEEHRPLSCYGIRTDSHIHMRPRLRGGRGFETLLTFVSTHKEFLKEVLLPDGTTSIELTEMGYLILASIVHCFTATFVAGKCWDGTCGLWSFKVVRGRARIIQKPTADLDKIKGRKDCSFLTGFIRSYFVLDNKYPPYLLHLLTKLENLSVDILSKDEQLALDTHLSLSPSLCRVSLVYHIKRRYDGWGPTEKKRFRELLEHCSLPGDWLNTVQNVVVFLDVIAGAEARNHKYGSSGMDAFNLTRNYNTHAPEYSWVEIEYNGQYVHYQWFECNSGLELMLPKYLKDFLAEVVWKLIQENFDIRDTLMTSHVWARYISDSSSDSSSSSSSNKKRKAKLTGSSKKVHPKRRRLHWF